jgi:hypothetical protein
MSIAQLVSGTDPVAELGLSLYEIQPIPGKGKGLVARFSIAKGTRILVEEPLFTVLSAAASSESNIVTKVKSLSKDQQRQYLSLHNNFPGKNIFDGIYKTNALPCGAGSTTGGVYPTICLINHCCFPNSHQSWSSEEAKETIHALRNIKAGEEIAITYLQHQTSQVRRSELRISFGFECSCDLCSLPAAELQKSDARRLEIERLDGAIGDPTRVISTPTKVFADCKDMLCFIKEEFGGSCSPLEARLYYDAFRTAIMHGDQARASVLAEKAYKARALCEGEDNPETVKMKSFIADPATHICFGISKRWRTTRSAVPKGLSEEDFEKWLWRS